jgi:hypothetical protein
MAPMAFAFVTLRSASSGVIPSALALDMQITVIIPMIPSASIQRNGLNPFLFAIIAEMIPRRILVIVTMMLPLQLESWMELSDISNQMSTELLFKTFY